MASGEFHGHYCKISNVHDDKLLCVKDHSRDERADCITCVDQEPERFVNPKDYVHFEPKQPLDYQQWLMIWRKQDKAYKIINRQSGMLLCVESRSQDNGHWTIQYHDQNLSFQWWQVKDEGKGRFSLVNKNSNKVLTTTTRSDSLVVQQNSKWQNSQQQWDITSLFHSGYVGEYQIKSSPFSSKLLCIWKQGIGDGGSAVIYDDQDRDYQWWRIFVHGWEDGAFEIQNVQSGKFLCIDDESTSDDAKVVQYHNTEESYQKWHLSLATSHSGSTSDLMKIKNAKSNLLLTVLRTGQVVQYHDENQTYQWWKFIKHSGDMDLAELIRFYNSPPKDIPQQLPQAADLEKEMCPELREWYLNFIKTLVLEVLGLMGVDFSSNWAEDLVAVANLVLEDPSVVAQLEDILEKAVTVLSVVKILKLLWDKKLWSEIFRMLLNKLKYWSFETLAHATAYIASWIFGAQSYSTALKMTKTVTTLAQLYSEKPDCKQ